MKTKTKMITYVAIFSALICVLSVVAFPTPWGVPFTLQTFIITLTGFSLGKKYGTFCVLIYLLLGAIGLPVFAGLTGGIGKFVSVTGGFLYGFIFLCFFCGYNKLIFSFLGLFICHLLGVLQFSFLTKNTILQSILIVSLPYVIKDILSLILAYFIGKKIKKHTDNFININ